MERPVTTHARFQESYRNVRNAIPLAAYCLQKSLEYAVRRLCAIAFIAICPIACVHTPRSLPPDWSILAGEPSGLTSLSDPITLIADNQLHNVYAHPVPLYRTSRTDRYIPSAIRSALLDFYGQDVLRWVVRTGAQPLPIVHLGDACDFSCTGEFVEFCEIMASAPEGWVMAPGNHDGFFYGNEHRSKSDGTWLGACQNSGRPMTKDRFIRLYVGALLCQMRPESNLLLAYIQEQGSPIQEADVQGLLAVPTDKLGCLIPDNGNWQSDLASFPRAISWHIDRKRPWRSFIVQRLELTSQDQLALPKSPRRVGAILLDTCQYEFAPGFVPIPPSRVAAGIRGEILDDQLDVVRAWLADERPRHDYYWILMGHHPFGVLKAHTRRKLWTLHDLDNLPLFVSAHTHQGDFIVHEGNDDAFLELNIGSILDWPLEFRSLYFGAMDDQRTYIRSERISAHELLSQIIDDQDRLHWQVTQEDDDYYLRHVHLDSISAIKTELELKNALLATHRRMLNAIGTDQCANPTPDDWPRDRVSRRRLESDSEIIASINAAMADASLENKINVLLELRRFEQARLELALNDECSDYEYFRLTQAIWASKYDAARARKPWPDDWIIALPPEDRP